MRRRTERMVQTVHVAVEEVGEVLSIGLSEVWFLNENNELHAKVRLNGCSFVKIE